MDVASQHARFSATDGRVRYRLHRPWPMPGGRTEILLQPLAFMKRHAALLPAPYQNMLRYHGVFANRSRFRDRLPPPPKRADKFGMGATSAPCFRYFRTDMSPLFNATGRSDLSYGPGHHPEDPHPSQPAGGPADYRTLSPVMAGVR